MTAISHNAPTSFEETWPKAPFAGLIGLALSLSATLAALRTRVTASAPADMGHGQHA